MAAAGPTWSPPGGRAHLRFALVALLGVAIQAALWMISEPADLFSDFYKAYFPAGETLWQNRPGPTWETEESSALGFVNLPILAWLFVPLSLLGEPAAGWVFLGLGVAATGAAYALLLRLGQLDGWPAVLLAFCILANGPLVNSLREGNTTHLVLLLMIAALLLWRAGAGYCAGLLLGLCALLKLPLMLIGLYFLFRRRWRVVAGGASMIGGAVLLSVVVFGIETNIGWYRHCIEPFMGGVMPAFNVQSVDGFLMRLETGPARLMDWNAVATPLWHKIVRSIVLSGLFILAFVALYRGGSGHVASREGGERDGEEREGLEFSIVLVLAVVTSPLSWSHYYLLLLLPWALHLSGRLRLPDDAATRWMMGGGMALASLPVVALPLGLDMIGAILSRSLVSAWLFGGLLMLAALVRGALHASDPVAAVKHRAASP